MPYRYIYIRTVDPNINQNGNTEVYALSLIRVALAAAEETILGVPLASPWLGLFQGHLSKKENTWLRWKDDLAVSAEMRRAYSAIYGRFFARGLLTKKFGFENFVSLERNRTVIKNGVSVCRIKKGSIPDWIVWDPSNNSYAMVEAKGVLRGKGRNFLYERPSCIEVGKKQFQRVRVKDRSNRLIRTRNWVAANLWSTDANSNSHKPVSLLWDPEGTGEDLSSGEIQEHRFAIHKHRMAKLATGMGFSIQSNGKISGLNVEVTVKPKSDEMPPHPDRELEIDALTREHKVDIDIVSRETHEGCYIASLITSMGIHPIANKSDLEEVKAFQKKAQEEDREAMIYGLSAKMLSELGSSQEPWLSSSGIVSTDGASLFKLSEVEFK